MISRRSQGSALGLILAAVAGSASGQAPAAEAAPWGTLRGRVVFRGEPPAPRVIFQRGQAPLGRDGALLPDSEPLFDERWVVDPRSRGVRNVLVYLPRPTAVRESAREAASRATSTFVVASGRFDPHVLAVMAGSKVDVRSLDPIDYGLLVGTQETQIARVLKPFESRVLTLGAAERRPAGVRDVLHPWMRAKWFVADNPYFAVSDPEGRFEIKDVPAGPQRVVAWHEAIGWVTAGQSEGEEVTIVAGGTTDREFTIDEERARPNR